MNDIMVIGGGIAGLSAAARLSPLAQVTVLEAEDALGYHASGRSAAMFEENYGSPSTVALNRASAAYHKDAGVLSPRGFILIGTADSDAAFQTDLIDLEMTEIPVDQAVAHVPILNPKAITRTGFHAGALDIDTDLLLQGFARTARGHGAKIHTGARVTDITRTVKGWQVRTANETFDAALLINAAGAWADQIAVMAGIAPIGIQPYRRSVARIPAPGGHDVSDWPMIFGAGETWYAKPDAGKLLVSPAEEHPMDPHDAWADDMVLAEGISRYQAVVTQEVTRVESNWAGLRSFAPDRSLVIGFEPSDRSFFWLVGQGGYGMQSSPAASQLAADLIAGRTPQIDDAAVKALDPARFANRN